MSHINLFKHILKNEKEKGTCYMMKNAYSINWSKIGRHYYTHKNRSYNTNNMYNTMHPNYLNNSGNATSMNSGYNNNGYNGNSTLLNQPHFNYDSHNNNNSNGTNYYSTNKNNFQQSLNSSPVIYYQYFSIFGSTAMCLIKPIFPEKILNKNKLTILGKGGFQFMFMKKQNNTNKYDKNNKMNIFAKINSLSNILFLTDVENLKTPLTIKGTNNNYLIVDKHKEKKDHLILKYKYHILSNTTTITENNNVNDDASSETNNTPNLTIDINDSINEPVEEQKQNNFQELYVTFPFSEFLIFQKAANLLLPDLLGWTK